MKLKEAVPILTLDGLGNSQQRCLTASNRGLTFHNLSIFLFSSDTVLSSRNFSEFLSLKNLSAFVSNPIYSSFCLPMHFYPWHLYNRHGEAYTYEHSNFCAICIDIYSCGFKLLHICVHCHFTPKFFIDIS